MAEPKIKLTFPELALLDWLCEPGPARRLFTYHPHIRSGGSMHYYELSEPNEEGKRTPNMIQDRQVLHQLHLRFGRENFSTMNLYRSKLLSNWHSLGHHAHGDKSSYEKLIDLLTRNPFHYADNIYAPSKAGRAYWENTGKAELERLREQQRNQRESVARTIVIGATDYVELSLDADMRKAFPSGFPLPLPKRRYRRAYATAEVVKETASRLYLTNVKQIPGGQVNYNNNPIEGREPNCYIPREAVLLDHASPAAIRALIALDEEHIDSQQQALRSAFDQMLPILQALDSRLAQQAAMRDDMLRETLARFTAAPDEPADEKQPDEPGAKP